MRTYGVKRNDNKSQWQHIIAHNIYFHTQPNLCGVVSNFANCENEQEVVVNSIC
ncbi:hypothetical protein CDAR_592931, partial [Caerostris darwini]